jgi:hypothetical protein
MTAHDAAPGGSPESTALRAAADRLAALAAGDPVLVVGSPRVVEALAERGVAAKAQDTPAAIDDDHRLVVLDPPGAGPAAEWAGDLAEAGWFRRADVDLAGLSPRAAVFEKRDVSARTLVERYERLLGDGPAAEVLEARHRLLVNRDHVVGLEGEVGRANAHVARLVGELRRAERRAERLDRRVEQQARRIESLQAKGAGQERRTPPPAPPVPPAPSFSRRVARRVRRALR